MTPDVVAASLLGCGLIAFVWSGIEARQSGDWRPLAVAGIAAFLGIIFGVSLAFMDVVHPLVGFSVGGVGALASVSFRHLSPSAWNSVTEAVVRAAGTIQQLIANLLLLTAFLVVCVLLLRFCGKVF